VAACFIPTERNLTAVNTRFSGANHRATRKSIRGVWNYTPLVLCFQSVGIDNAIQRIHLLQGWYFNPGWRLMCDLDTCMDNEIHNFL